MFMNKVNIHIEHFIHEWFGLVGFNKFKNILNFYKFCNFKRQDKVNIEVFF